MSRVGQKPIKVPSGVAVAFDGANLTIKGAKGELGLVLFDEIVAVHEDDQIVVTPRADTKRARTMWGLQRSLIDNMVTGVSQGFTVNLEIQGVGYRAAVEDRTLKLLLGYSHDIEYAIPDGIEIACERPTLISVSGVDRQKVGQVAADIRGYRKPEPYKGKGIRYAGEIVHMKEGKKK
jgi:large subunit ribosomal protein L6